MEFGLHGGDSDVSDKKHGIMLISMLHSMKVHAKREENFQLHWINQHIPFFCLKIGGGYRN